MCGRMSVLFTDKDVKAQKDFMITKVNREFSPRYNLAPTQGVPVIVPGSRVLDVYRWGLIPHWAKDKKIGSKMINARGETIDDKPSFRDSFHKRRCLILSSGFFEWDASKTPFFIKLKSGGIMAFAGLYDEWVSGDEVVKSCTVITIGANDWMKKLHHRMPVILSPEQFSDWLNPGNKNIDVLQGMLKSCDSSLLRADEVSTLVNSVKNDGPDIFKPVTKKQTTL